jgi:L-rhamnose-H+ transport protein
MEASVYSGLLLSLLAGSMLGTFAWPMKKIRNWKWEHVWLTYSVWALIILPWIWAYTTVPDLSAVYSGVPGKVIFIVFLFGAGWGIASMTFGIGMSALGIALGTAIVLGLNNAIGSILPLILYTPDELLTPAGIHIILGVAIILSGIAVCAYAGMSRERVLNIGLPKSANYTKGVIVCVISGLLGPMFNFALIEGKPLELLAVQSGASPLNAANPTWAISLTGGFLITAIYCIYLIQKGKSGQLFLGNKNNMAWVFTLLMGIMWFGGVALYGTAVMSLGKLGPAIGWPLIQSMAVISGSIAGIILGEWKNSGRKPLTIMVAGLLLMTIGIVVVSRAGVL